MGRPSDFLPTEGRGIKFLGNSDPDGAITGRVRVVDNVIEDMHADLSDAIVLDAVAADVDIIGNEIRTVQSSGIFVIDSAAQVRIERNVIEPGPGDPPPAFSFGNGISIVGSNGARYIVRHNDVVCENPLADGIAVVASSSDIVGAVLEHKLRVLDVETRELSDVAHDRQAPFHLGAVWRLARRRLPRARRGPVDGRRALAHRR